jgi:hypothetical protein
LSHKRVQKKSDVGGHIEDLNGVVAIDLKPPGSAEASMASFVLIVSVMVAPDRLGANGMTAPLAALVTTCAEAVAPTVKTTRSRAGIKTAGIPNNLKRVRSDLRAEAPPSFGEGFRLFKMLVFQLVSIASAQAVVLTINQCEIPGPKVQFILEESAA